MKTIKITKGLLVIVDDDDYRWLIKRSWYALINTGHPSYARTTKGRQTILMHREILNAPDGIQVDHINGDGLDNRRNNLRLATIAQNNQNVRVRSDNTSGFKGVCWHKRDRIWQAYINASGIRRNLGSFVDLNQAVRAYNIASRDLHGEFSKPNIIANPYAYREAA